MRQSRRIAYQQDEHSIVSHDNRSQTSNDGCIGMSVLQHAQDTLKQSVVQDDMINSTDIGSLAVTESSAVCASRRAVLAQRGRTPQLTNLKPMEVLQMKLTCRSKTFPLKGFCFLVALCMLAGGTAYAETGVTAYAETGGQYTASDGAEVRVAYEGVLNAYEAMAARYEIEGREEVIADARDALASVTDEELAPLAEILPKIQQWRQETDLLVASAGSAEAPSTEKSDQPVLVTSDGFPDAVYHWSHRPDENEMMIVLLVMNTATGVQLAADQACEQFFFHPPCILTDIIYTVALFVYETLDQKYNDFTGEEVYASYLRLGHLHTDLVDVADSVNIMSVSQVLMAAEIDLIRSGLDQVRAEFEAWTILALRTKVEQNLARHGQQVHPLAIFVLPAAFGGHLEVAREIVAETISNMMAAGQRVYFAEEQLTKGDDELAVGNYKKAYDYFGAAYLSATK